MPSPLRPPIGFAHRGARSERRENTLEAFSRALELGATGLESDAWITADGVVVLDHDGVIGLPLRRRQIRDHARTKLPSHIPALADLYRELGTDFQLSLDIKNPAAFDPILDVATKAGGVERLWLCDADFQRVTRWVQSAGSARMVLSTQLEDLDRVVPEGFSQAVASLAMAGASALNLHGSEWTAERVAVARSAGLLAFGWDAQSDHHISRLVRLGADGIYSDHVDRLMAEIGRAPRDTQAQSGTQATDLAPPS